MPSNLQKDSLKGCKLPHMDPNYAPMTLRRKNFFTQGECRRTTGEDMMYNCQHGRGACVYDADAAVWEDLLQLRCNAPASVSTRRTPV
jgi:hypothetical protein